LYPEPEEIAYSESLVFVEDITLFGDGKARGHLEVLYEVEVTHLLLLVYGVFKVFSCDF